MLIIKISLGCLFFRAVIVVHDLGDRFSGYGYFHLVHPSRALNLGVVHALVIQLRHFFFYLNEMQTLYQKNIIGITCQKFLLITAARDLDTVN